VHAIAIVVLGGVVTSTLLTLVGVPAVYVLYGATREPELDVFAATGLTEISNP